ncbi:uncharacterized protein YjiS (DUF1127 family) [Ancylobacter sp. 3268]|uniref:DUF1127 domain-containing protein n=1 Tax=Ancylobacter sp. 3268 TaxID=2817752 RepID=UPI00285841CA|nr:DUF1127 domain-containing protein [Ancylobacter sp. 3268]MDR6954000.1 uncharacterized protein YjiS (DUF1127 family) [Ancylobacter sp. 3268]
MGAGRAISEKAHTAARPTQMEESMSYMGEVRRTAFSSFGAAASGLLAGAYVNLVRIAKAVHRRSLLNQLGDFDDRMLKDIGLTRADLRDAASGPVWQDPTSVLVVRAVERRAGRRQAVRASLDATRPHSGASAAEPKAAPREAAGCH